jgi:hypothetical protein
MKERKRKQERNLTFSPSTAVLGESKRKKQNV